MTEREKIDTSIYKKDTAIVYVTNYDEYMNTMYILSNANYTWARGQSLLSLIYWTENTESITLNIYMDSKKVTWREYDARRNYPHFLEIKPKELKYMLF